MPNSTDDYRFFPHPDAHRTYWCDLLSPVRGAVRELLVRVSGAVDKVKEKHPDESNEDYIANCFLVYGDRGTGKTTVLLNAAEAVYHCEPSFFPKNSNNDFTRSAQICADNLSGQVEWLEILDLEPLPPKANLLTILLTRVRNALDVPGNDGVDIAPTSLFEEHEDGARQQLSRLINDATLMWEDISETDTRSKANRQVAAADIYAGFRKRFLKAITALSKELDIRHGRREGFRPIVLPIDNIDRSTEHLYNIIKLAQMVSCRQLFLVMAGDRMDVDIFLERAYWKELIHTGDGSNASGKKGLSGEDEAFVMARRQSAAAAQKLLPPSHRVEVRRVGAVETLAFRPRQEHPNGEANRDDDKRRTVLASIGDLLKQINIPEWKGGLFSNAQHPTQTGTDETEGKWGKKPLNLLDLFDASPLLSDEAAKQETSANRTNDCDSPRTHGPSNPRYLTFAGKHGLLLPARGVLDLWQLTYWVVNDKAGFSNKKDLRAEKIARTMLRNLTAESNMSTRLGHLLQDRLIRRNPEGGTILDFKRVPLEITYLRNQRNKLRLSPVLLGDSAKSRWSIRSALNLYAVESVILSIEDIKKPGAKGTLRVSELPQVVAAWLTVLHDIVLWAEQSVVIRSNIPIPQLVIATHERRCAGHGDLKPVEFFWPTPRWSSFLAHNLFVMHWMKVFEKLEAGGDWEENFPGFDELIHEWLDCAIKTHYAFRSPTQDRSMNPTTEEQAEGANNGSNSPDSRSENKGKHDTGIDSDINEIYTYIRDVSARVPGAGLVSRPNLWFDAMQGWIERGLPLLLSPLYVPASSEEELRKRWEKTLTQLNIQEDGQAGVLYGVIKENAPFIVEQLSDDLKTLFSIMKPSMKHHKKSDKKKKPPPPESILPDSLSLFELLPALLDKNWPLNLEE